MKFHHLLHQRDTLLRQARLANLAFAYQRLADWAARIARARLQGAVTLQLADPSLDRHWPVLLAHDGRQSVLEEHFLDEDVGELADLLSFLHEGDGLTEFTFRLEELAARYLPGLRGELAQAGIAPDQSAPSPEDSAREHG
ncbi:MAG: hypothetical protein NTV51_14130 [Verrucomicrobia bacterium]|nr:hypothetical protein [Verrucomicrobiota bacterium]